MKQCSWERCMDPATQMAEWKNVDGKPHHSTWASYCDVHVHEAVRNGAVFFGPIPTCDCGAQAESPTGPWHHKRGCAIPGPHNDGSKHLTLVKS